MEAKMEVGFEVWYKNVLYKNLRDDLWYSGVVQSKGVDEEGTEFLVVRNAKNVDATVKLSKEFVNVFLKNPFPSNSSEENLCNLPYLNEPEILLAVQNRYKRDEVCTYVGPVLISMNCFRENPDISMLNLNNAASTRVRDLAANAFAKIRESFTNAGGDAQNKAALQHARHHSILISGETGAGKSETSKLLLKHLIDENAIIPVSTTSTASAATTTEERPTVSKRALSRNFSKKFSFVSGLSGIIDKIALASVVLEAFGNAKTLVNDNSTRFGLFTQVQYTDTGMLIGGQLHTYLLEWNRLHTQQLGERNFHIFYQLVAGASEEEKNQWGITSLRDYQILNQGRASNVSHIDDAGDFSALKEHLEDLDIDKETIGKLLRAVVAVMQLGQVQFKATFEDNGEGCAIVDMEAFEKIAALVGVSVKDFESLLVLRNSLVIRGESFERKMTTTHAVSARHAVSVAIYKRLFKWLVNTLNTKIAPSSGTVEATVGILDIFGFRSHEINVFEDLCMNYANEILQQQMNHQIFKTEAAYYKLEAITHDPNSKVFDVATKQVVDLIGSDIFNVLDEVCNLPDSTDNKIAKQLYSKCDGKPAFSASELNRTDKSFTVRHYASHVTYTMKGFIEKNMDELPVKFNAVIDSSSNLVLAGNNSPSSPKKSAAPRRAGQYQAQQVMHTFKDQLTSLIERIQSTDSQFVRCVKPTETMYHRANNKKRTSANTQGLAEKESHTFHSLIVAEQLRNGGVFEAARAARSQFSVQVKHIDFYNRYRLLVVTANPSLNSELPNLFYDDAIIDDVEVAKYCKRIVDILKTDARIVKYLATVSKTASIKIQVGATKVFLTPTDHIAVESVLNAITLKAKTTVHNFCACIITRKWFKKAIKAMHLLQKNCRMAVHKRRFLAMKNAIISLQRTHRRNRLLAIFFQAYDNFKTHIVKIQSYYRMHRAQLKLRRRARILKIIKNHEEELKGCLVLRDHRREKEAEDYQQWKNEQINPSPSTPVDSRMLMIRQKNVDNHLAAFRSLDEDLRMKLEAMIKALKPIEVIQKVLFDIGSSKKLLFRWGNSMPEGQLKGMSRRVCEQLEYGHKLLKTHKLVPKNMLKQMFGKYEDRINMPVDSKHPLFDNIASLITDLKYLVAVTDATRKSHTNALNVLKANGSKDTNQMAAVQQAILSVNNINKFCLILQNYYMEYIPFVVREYGSNSAYRKKFADNKTYLHALHALLTQGRPLNEDQELFLKSKHKKQNDNNLNVSVNNDFALKVREDDVSRIVSYSGLYFKYMPYAPGIEFSVNCVRSMFMTEPQTPTRVMRIKGVIHNQPKIAYYQAAASYSDVSLQDILSTPRGIELLDFESLSATILTNILMGCSVVHPENVMVLPSKDPSGQVFSVKVLGITNNYAFTEGVFDYKTLSNATTSELFKKFGYHKYQSGCANNNLNALFFLPQMDEPVDPVVRAMFTKNGSAPEQFVSEWLKFLYLRNKGYEGLTKVGFTDNDFSSLKLPIYLPKRVGISMYRRLRVINSLFHPVQGRRHASETVVPNVTHQMILSAFCPYVGKFYANQRKSFEFPEYANLIPFNVMYSETLAERAINKRHSKRKSVAHAKEDKQHAREFVAAAVSHAHSTPASPEQPATMAQRLIQQRKEDKDKRPSVSFGEDTKPGSISKSASDDYSTPTKERPQLTTAMSMKFAQIYGTPATKANFREAFKDSHNEKSMNQSYISLDFGGIYGEEDDFNGNANGEDDEVLYTNENAGGGPPEDNDFDFDNIYNELDFAYDHQSTTQDKKVRDGEVIEYQSPPKRELPTERVVSFMVDVNDIYGGKDDEFDYSRYKKDSDDEQEEEEEDQDEDGEERDNDLNNQSMYSTASDSEANASKYGEKFSFGPTVLTHDAEESDALFNTSIADVAAEFLCNVDFERLSIENNHEIVSRMIDNLFFVPKMTLYKVSEDQLKVMFKKYVDQGLIGPLVKRQSAKYISGNSGAITAMPLKDGLVEPLLCTEIVIVHKDAELLESIKQCDVVERLESVLDITVTFVLV